MTSSILKLVKKIKEIKHSVDTLFFFKFMDKTQKISVNYTTNLHVLSNTAEYNFPYCGEFFLFRNL